MRIRGSITLALSSVAALALIAMVAAYLVFTDRSAGDRLREEFAHRAAIAGQLTSAAFTASFTQNRVAAEQAYSGDARSVQAALDKDPTTTFSTVVEADGTVLGARPARLREGDGADMMAQVRELALRRATMVFDDLARDRDGSRKLLLGVPFTAAGRQRVWIASMPVETLDTFAEGYLRSSLGISEGRAYITDSQGLLIARSGGGELTGPLPGHLVTALRGADAGTAGADYYVSALIPGTGWHVVFVAPEKVLLAPIQATRRLAWQIFGGFALAVLCMVALGATALARSARLAHERLHDALTGMPNRTLFLERVRRALAGRRRHDDALAVLFIDLDGFKPVNDAHGHATGDALLCAVARRLREVRPGDVVSRFGGDEFLVLCHGLAGERDAIAVAHRLADRLAEPYDVGGLSVRVGASIGVALADSATTDATALIHRADQAMYAAKHSGRGRVEVARTPVAAATAT